MCMYTYSDVLYTCIHVHVCLYVYTYPTCGTIQYALTSMNEVHARNTSLCKYAFLWVRCTYVHTYACESKQNTFMQTGMFLVCTTYIHVSMYTYNYMRNIPMNIHVCIRMTAAQCTPITCKYTYLCLRIATCSSMPCFSVHLFERVGLWH